MYWYAEYHFNHSNIMLIVIYIYNSRKYNNYLFLNKWTLTHTSYNINISVEYVKSNYHLNSDVLSTWCIIFLLHHTKIYCTKKLYLTLILKVNYKFCRYENFFFLFSIPRCNNNYKLIRSIMTLSIYTKTRRR